MKDNNNNPKSGDNKGNHSNENPRNLSHTTESKGKTIETSEMEEEDELENESRVDRENSPAAEDLRRNESSPDTREDSASRGIE